MKYPQIDYESSSIPGGLTLLSDVESKIPELSLDEFDPFQSGSSQNKYCVVMFVLE